MRRNRSCWLPLSLVLGAGAVCADEPSQDHSNIVDEVSPQAVIELSSAVADSLNSGQLNSEVVSQQQRIIDALQRMLGSARSESGGLPEAVSSQRGGSSASGSEAGKGTSQGSGEKPTGASSGSESSGTPQGEAPETTGDLKHREGLADAVWGHLPPRIRDELYRSYTERYAPKYDSLLRQYFEKLAEDATSRKPDR